MKRKSNSVKSIELYKQELQMYEQMPEQIMVLKGWTREELDLAVSDLKGKVALSQQGTSARTKGARYEITVAKHFLEKWKVRLVRTPMSGGFQKSSDNDTFRGDLSCIDPNIDFRLSPECKKQKTWKLREWFKQAEEDTPKGKIPVVIFHEFKKVEEGKQVRKAEDYVMIKLSDFLDIVDTQKVVLPKQKTKGIERNAKIRGNGRASKGIKRGKASRKEI